MSQDDTLTSALASAKYNEIVHVTISNNTAAAEDDGGHDDDAPSHQQELMLTATLDHENGGIRWNDISQSDDAIARHLRTKIWLVPMLNDEHRNVLYEKAIQEATQELARRTSQQQRQQQLMY